MSQKRLIEQIRANVEARSVDSGIIYINRLQQRKNGVSGVTFFLDDLGYRMEDGWFIPSPSVFFQIGGMAEDLVGFVPKTDIDHRENCPCITCDCTCEDCRCCCGGNITFEALHRLLQIDENIDYLLVWYFGCAPCWHDRIYEDMTVDELLWLLSLLQQSVVPTLAKI